VDSSGQDARVSQYHSIPLLVNPAHTGDFDGKLRVLGLGARVNSRYNHNYIFNASADLRFGSQEKWGLGLNYMQSGADRFPVSGRYFGLSAAKEFSLDKVAIQTLRVGAQVSYLTGKVDATQDKYDRLLDVRAFRYLNKPLDNQLNQNSADESYLNFSVGLKYKFELERLKIETGFSAYNVTNPDYNFPYVGTNTLLKRYRVTALSSIYYQYSQKNAFKIAQYSWKEGIFLRDYKPSRDTVEIHETTYSFTWLRQMRKHQLSLGLFSRSWQSVYGLVGLDFERFGVTASYELPILKHYYDIAHMELGLRFFPFKRKSEKKNRYDQMIRQLPGILPYDSLFKAPVLLKIPVSDGVLPDEQKFEKVP